MRNRWFLALVVASSAVVLSVTVVAAEPDKPIRIGMIGLDTSHVIAFSNLLNNPNATGDLADVQVVAGFPGGTDIPASADRVEKFTQQLREKGIEIVGSIDELLPKVDAVMIESVDGRPHLEQARPVFAAGKPLFIDKPFAGSLADAIEIVELSQKTGVPFFSCSSSRFSPDFQAVRKGEAGFGEIKRVTAHGPMSTEPHHPDLYWYGIHGCEVLYTILGSGCKTVTREGPQRVVGVWSDGRVGIFEGGGSIGAEVEGTEKSGSAGKYGGYGPLVEQIALFFKTRKPPIDAAETLELMAYMEAADESKRRGGEEVTIEEVMEKARKVVAERQK